MTMKLQHQRGIDRDGSVRAASRCRIGAAFLAALSLVAPAGVGPAGAQTGASDYQALWAQGRTYDAFLASATGRRALWVSNTERAEAPAALVERAAAVPGRWRLLVVAVDRCSDSVGTIPYVAALADAVPTVDMRIIPPAEGRSIMEAHRTPDGRAATPTVLLLDEGWNPVGAWVERPSELQAWYLANPEGLSGGERYRQKMAWYERDAGRSTQLEIVELLEAGAGVGRLIPSPSSGSGSLRGRTGGEA